MSPLLPRRWRRLVLVAVACICALQATWAQGLSEADRSRIEDLVIRELRNAGAPGASVALVINGQLALAQAYGRAQLLPARAAQPEMRFAIGSISKQFLAAAVLMLQAEGRLQLDDPAGRHLDGLGPVANVTIRQLLSHTAGLRDYWPQDYVPAEMTQSITHDLILQRWALQAPDFAAGRAWQYSNTGYTVAGAIVEKLTGEPLFKTLQGRIFKPLQMTSVLDVDQGRLQASDPVGYTGLGLGPLQPAPKEGPGWLFAAGGLAMTAADLARWDMALMQHRLMTPEVQKAMETDTLLDSGTSTRYGLGLFVRQTAGRRMLWHDGGVSGFTSRNTLYPDEGIAIVVLTNSDTGGAAGNISQRLQEWLFAKTTQQDEARLQRTKAIFNGLRQGRIDRSQFSDNGNDYFSPQALRTLAFELGRLGPVKSFRSDGAAPRGGMDAHFYVVELQRKTLSLVVRTWPDGRIEQFTVAPQ